MDMGEKDKYDMDNKNEDHLNYSSGMSLDWRFDSSNLPNSSLGLVGKCDLIGGTSCSSAPIANSFVPALWDQPTSYNESALSALGIRKGGGFDSCWNSPNSMLRGGLLLPSIPGAVPPQSLSQLPADSAFIERAARFSSFNGGGFGDIMNPFAVGPESSGLYPTGRDVFNGPRQRIEVNPSEASRDASVVAEGSPLMKNERRRSESAARSHDEARLVVGDGSGGGGSGNESDEEVEFSSGAGVGGGRDEPSMLEEASAKGISSRKRKRNVQDSGDQAKDPTKDKGGEQNPSTTATTNNKTAAKNGKQGSQLGSEANKEDYIHVRARRGQATNSHSLAERVRREKISERMKFLQDLVPGCSKVTGKAVMLDEIINYVQSLQRQVEFLSMKLATVNPRLDFNLETLLAKDMLQPRVASLSFAPDMPMAYPSLQAPQHGLILPPGLSGMGSASDILRRTIASSSSQLTPSLGGFKEPTQVTNVWEDELNNVIQMSFGTRTSPSSQDVDGSLPSGQMKVEL